MYICFVYVSCCIYVVYTNIPNKNEFEKLFVFNSSSERNFPFFGV